METVEGESKRAAPPIGRRRWRLASGRLGGRAGPGQVGGDVPETVPLLSDVLQVLLDEGHLAPLLLGRQVQLLDFAAQVGALHAAAQHAEAPRRLVQDAVEALQWDAFI